MYKASFHRACEMEEGERKVWGQEGRRRTNSSMISQHYFILKAERGTIANLKGYITKKKCFKNYWCGGVAVVGWQQRRQALARDLKSAKGWGRYGEPVIRHRGSCQTPGFYSQLLGQSLYFYNSLKRVIFSSSWLVAEEPKC